MADARISQLTAGTLNSTTLFPVAVTTSDTRSVQTNSFPNGTYRVGGLVGINGATSEYSLAADTVELWRPSDRTRRYATGTSALINDIGTTGNNGRDQAGAFTANNWLHLYFVGGNAVTSSTLATRSSLTAPPTGPTLPTSETHWAYAGAVRLGASTTLLPTRINDSWAMLNVEDGGVNRILSAGTSTAFATVDGSSLIPPNSRLAVINFIMSPVNPAETGTITVRPALSTEAGQQILKLDATPPGGGLNLQTRNSSIYPVSSSQSLEYFVNATSARAFMDVLGYQVANGGA